MLRAITCVAALSLAHAAFGQFTYQYDDGTGSGVGPGGPGTPGVFVWGNVFQAQPGATEITSIQVAFGTVPAGATMTALLYDDPNDDGNPDDCVLLASQDFVPAATQSNAFTEVEITPTVVHGRFFVACAGNVEGTGLTAIARQDLTTGGASGSNTFFYWGSAFHPLTFSGYTGRIQRTGVATVMVRAIGREPVVPPACPADLGVAGGEPGNDGLLDNNDFIAFITHFFNQSAQADLGAAGGEAGSDGLFDNNDFIAFITLFFDGC